MRTPSSPLAARGGFTLVEVLIAMTVLLVGVLGTLALIDRANATTVTTRSREGAVNVARELVEAARSVPFAKLDADLARDGDRGAARPRRRRPAGRLDDPPTRLHVHGQRDGVHVRRRPGRRWHPHAGGFCADSAAPSATPDRNPEDYRRVRVEVRWSDRGRDRVVHQTVLVNNPGSAGAPAVRTLVIDTGTGTAISPVTNHVYATPADNTMPFDLTTSSAPATLHWLLDGTSQAPITTAPALSWTFGWPVGHAGDPDSLVDGTYVVSAEAFDTYGVVRPFALADRHAQPAPAQQGSGLVGGRTGDPPHRRPRSSTSSGCRTPSATSSATALQRTDAAGNVVEVLPARGRTACLDADPPVEDGLVYRVYAWDRNHVDGQPRISVPSDPLVVDLGNNPPAPPVSPQAQLQADGSVQLSWTRPSPEDPDAGDSIAFFRVYRDGSGFDSRYAVWNGTDFNDGNTGNTAHEYWITSVDSRYGESAPVKAVAP